MGMDVYGRNPTTEEGKYFRDSWSAWHLLAFYAAEVAPDIAARCENWHNNDGDGLDAEHSLALADWLQAEIDAGRTAWYERLLSRQKGGPKACVYCEGTGTCDPFLRLVACDPKNGGIRCDACDGTGVYQYFLVGNVRRFVAFLRGSGGFEIW